MNKAKLVLVLGGLVLCAIMVRSSDALPYHPGVVAGTYLFEDANFDLGPNTLVPPGWPYESGAYPSMILMTLTSDGCAVQVDSTGYALLKAGDFESTAVACWEFDGPLSAHITTMCFGYDLAGRLRSIVRTTATMEFDDDWFETGQAKFVAEAFRPWQDPLDPTEVPFDKYGNTYDFRKISAR